MTLMTQSQLWVESVWVQLMNFRLYLAIAARELELVKQISKIVVRRALAQLDGRQAGGE